MEKLMKRSAWLLLLAIFALILITACQPSQPTQTTPGNSDPALTTDESGNGQSTASADITSESMGPTTIPIPETIEWSRDPSAIVFRAEISSGSAGDTPETAYIRNEVPPCTIYGDNRVVWTTTNIRTDDGVVFDVLPDETIRDFILRLLTEYNLYGYTSSPQTPDASGEAPVVERLTLTINNETYVTDSFSGWDFNYFSDVLQDCRTLSSAPIAFEPQGAWVTVRNMGYNPSRPTLYWDAEANGLQLSELSASSSPQWMTGEPVNQLWELIRTGGIDILLQEEGSDYLVTVEVPNITRNAPPAPSS
jgi:hypothetical protein